MSRFGESIRQFGGVILSSAIILMVFAGLAVILDIPGTGGTEANEAPDMLSTDTVTSDSTGSTASGALEDLFTTIDLMDSTVTELQSEMEKGNLTSVQLTQMYADRIEAYDRELDLFERRDASQAVVARMPLVLKRKVVDIVQFLPFKRILRRILNHV